MTCSMVFQSPHGRLNYGFMSLDIAYFNFTFIKSMQCCHITFKRPCFISSFFLKKNNIAHAWYEFKIKSVQHIAIHVFH